MIDSAMSTAEFAVYARRFQRYVRVRPMALAAFLIKVLIPHDRRRVVATNMGTRLWLDPVSRLAASVAATGTYEPETLAMLSQLKAGDVFLDIGANEGVFSAYAATRVGPTGTVIAIEPQARLTLVLLKNLDLNGPTRFNVLTHAIGEAPGTVKDLKLYPDLNTGASSFVRGPRSGAKHSAVTFISPENALERSGVDHADFVKVDVEGYEGHVVDALLPLLQAGRIGRLLIDYHAPILAGLGVDPAAVHRKVLGAGFTCDTDDDTPFSGYRLYHRRD